MSNEEKERSSYQAMQPKKIMIQRKPGFPKPVINPEVKKEIIPPPVLISALEDLSQPHIPEKSKGRSGNRGYHDTPSLSAEEWHEFYWYPDSKSINLSEIESGLSTLAIVLVGKDISKTAQAYFVKNKQFVKNYNGNDVVVNLEITPDTFLVLGQQDKFGKIKRQIPIEITSKMPTTFIPNSYVIIKPTDSQKPELYCVSALGDHYGLPLDVFPRLEEALTQPAKGISPISIIQQERHSIFETLGLRAAHQADFSVQPKSGGPGKISSFYVMDEKDQVLHSRELAYKHAERRVTLFFYLMAYYCGTQRDIKIHRTEKQRGKGVRLTHTWGTEGAHSAPLPSLIDQTAPSDEHDTRYGGSNWSLNDVEFGFILNSTVELLASFNYFDTTFIESVMRDKALVLLNQVSKGQLTPIEGLEQFFKLMQENLESQKMEFLNRKTAVKKSPKQTREGVFDAAWEGTFAGKWNTTLQQFEPGYLELLLGIPTGQKISEVDLEPYYAKIRAEILSEDPPLAPLESKPVKEKKEQKPFEAEPRAGSGELNINQTPGDLPLSSAATMHGVFRVPVPAPKPPDEKVTYYMQTFQNLLERLGTTHEAYFAFQNQFNQFQSIQNSMIPKDLDALRKVCEQLEGILPPLDEVPECK